MVILDIKWIYKYSLKSTKFKNTIDRMAIEYIKMDGQKREIFKMRLKDRANDFDKLTWLSLIFITVPIIVNGISSMLIRKLGRQFLTDNFPIIIGMGLYVLIASFVLRYINQYRKTKLFLEVIEHVNDGKIIVYKDGKKLK